MRPSVNNAASSASPAFSPVVLSLIFLALATAAVFPLTLFDYGGDIMFQYVAIKCFGSQFWAGEMYPRWCFDAHAGLGSPVFVFYPPLPFYASSLLYPLTWLGLDLPSLYLLCLWLATLVTAFTAWWWLRDITSPKLALFITVIYLWLPYRMELMMFRSAYGELWCMAWLPLVIKYLRLLMQGQLRAVPKLSVALALCFLSNMPAAVIIVLASGVYALCMGVRHLRLLVAYGLALLWSSLLAAFYVVPAILYKPFITTEGVISGVRSWSNDFLSMDNVTVHGQGHVVVAIALMLVATAGLMLMTYLRRNRVSDHFMKREMRTWSLVIVIAVFMLFPFSKPVWEHLGFISMLAFPWRMQLVIAVGATFLAAVLCQHMLAQSRKTNTGDTVMVLALLALVSMFVISACAPDHVTYGDKILASQFVTQREYRTIWTDKPNVEMKAILQRHDNRAPIPKLGVVSGDASVIIMQWQLNKIVLDVKATTISSLRIDLQYFPIWQAKTASKKLLELSAEEGSGQMLLTLAPGQYNVTIKPSIFAILPWKIALAHALSAFAFVMACYGCQRRRKAHV
jgi:hypothetical protein